MNCIQCVNVYVVSELFGSVIIMFRYITFALAQMIFKESKSRKLSDLCGQSIPLTAEKSCNKGLYLF